MREGGPCSGRHTASTWGVSEKHWLTRLNLLYLAVVPAFLVGSLIYLVWVYLTV